MAFPRVLLADDTPEMLQQIKHLLHGTAEIVGMARNGREALELAAFADVDVLILDISMPLLNGIQVASMLRERGHMAKIVFVTVHEDRDYIEAAWSVGALGYVLKSRLGTDLIPALQEAAAGRAFISSTNAGTLEGQAFFDDPACTVPHKNGLRET